MTRVEASDADSSDFYRLLRRHGIRPSKRLGQHFLLDRRVLRRVVDTADLDRKETVLEIGAGIGSLTRELALAARRVIAVEIDPRLIPALHEAVHACSNVQVIQADILSLDLPSLFGEEPYCVVANIPYQITSLLIRRLLETEHPPGRLVLTVQREVAERVVAGGGEMSLLALGVQLYGAPRIVGEIPAGSFHPPPEVDSAILRVDLHARPRLGPQEIEAVFRLARAGFGQKRKQLRNAVAAGLRLEPAAVEGLLRDSGIDPRARAQDLSLETWERLAKAALDTGVL